VPVGGLVSFASFASKSSCEFDEEAEANHAAFARQPPPPAANCSRYNGAIYGGLIASTVLLGGGLAMLLVGAKKVPVERAAEVSVRPWLSPTTAGLGLSTSF